MTDPVPVPSFPLTDLPLPSTASLCMETAAPVAPDCCENDAEERGFYNARIVLRCPESVYADRIVIPAGTIFSSLSQGDADDQAYTLARSLIPTAISLVIPEWDELFPSQSTTPISVYGSPGFDEFRTGGTSQVFDTCTNTATCVGPVQEGLPMSTLFDRYATPWEAMLKDGEIFYRRSDGSDWIQVPVELIPQPNLDMGGLGFCFDANARPCFASEISGEIHIWRYQGGIPTEFTITGSSPKLFFNGVLQPDDTLRDIVCYFSNDGSLCAAFQREDFSTTYILFSDSEYPIDDIKQVLVNSDLESGSREYVVTSNATNILFRSPAYPPWPALAYDGVGSSAAPQLGSHSLVLVGAGEYSDTATSSAAPLDGVHRAVLLTLATESDSMSSSVSSITGYHKLVLITLPTEADASTSSTAPSSGVHRFTLIQAGIYVDSAASTTSPQPGSYIHV